MGRKFSIHLVCCLSGALGAGACRCTLVPCPEPSRRQEGMETQLPEEPHQVVYQYLGRHLPRDDSRAKGSLCTSINPWPTCPLEARMGPFSLTLPLTHSSLSHRAPSPEHTGHWALGTGRPPWQGFLLCRQRLAPFIPISAPTLPSLGFPPPSRRGKHGQCALQVPSAHFKPQNTRLAFVTRTLRGSFISPTPQLRQIKGLVATCSPSPPALLLFSPTRPSKSSAHAGARRLFLRLE